MNFWVLQRFWSSLRALARVGKLQLEAASVVVRALMSRSLSGTFSRFDLDTSTSIFFSCAQDGPSQS